MKALRGYDTRFQNLPGTNQVASRKRRHPRILVPIVALDRLELGEEPIWVDEFTMMNGRRACQDNRRPTKRNSCGWSISCQRCGCTFL